MQGNWFCGALLLQCLVAGIQAQSYLRLNGVVLSNKSATPIAYAHVGIPAQGMGVVSNEAGAFTLNYPAAYAKDSLKVSCLGFKTYTIPLAKLRLEDTLIIRLKPEVLELAEAMVKPHSDSGRMILREALKRLKKNFPTKMHQLNAFYREKVQTRDDYEYTRLMEGMVDIQDWGIDSDPTRTRIRLNEYRKSNNNAKQSFGQRAWNMLSGNHNNLYAILAQDPVRIHTHNERTIREAAGMKWATNSRHYWLGEIFKSPNSSVRLVEMTSYDGELVYHIKFHIPDKRGAVYVNSKDYGIHHIDFYEGTTAEEFLYGMKADTNAISEFKKQQIKETQRFLKNAQYEGKYMGKLNVDYQKINGKYYLSHIEWMTMGDFRKSKVNEGKTTGSYNFCTLMVNEIQTEKREMAKVKPREVLNRNEDTDDLRRQYNERFWRNYNVLLANPLERKAIRDLTFEESLEQQFKKNQ